MLQPAERARTSNIVLFQRHSPSLTLKRPDRGFNEFDGSSPVLAKHPSSYAFNSRSMSTSFPFGTIQEYVPD